MFFLHKYYEVKTFSKKILIVFSGWQVKKNAMTAETSSADASAEQFRLKRVMKIRNS
jgi:hypothetical protein